MQKLARVTMPSAAGGAPQDQGWRGGGMQGARGSGDARPKSVDNSLDLQWRQRAPRESLILAESAGKLLTQINE